MRGLRGRRRPLSRRLAGAPVACAGVGVGVDPGTADAITADATVQVVTASGVVSGAPVGLPIGSRDAEGSRS